MNRADRRRREKEDERSVARGLDISARDRDEMSSLIRIVYREVIKARSTGSVAGLFQMFYGSLAKTDLQAPQDLIACRKGCSHCCKMWVSATAPEIFQLVRFLHKGVFDLDRIKRKAFATRGLDFDARGREIHGCPLLAEDESCSVYAARPVACRTATSSDAEQCFRAYMELSGEGVPALMFSMLQRSGYMMALRGAFNQAGLRLETYELNEALMAALETQDAERRWLSGEDIFAGVQRDPAPNPVDDPDAQWFFANVFEDG